MSTKISSFNAKNKKRGIVILITLIVALGFFLRIYNLNHIPGVYPDEAVNGEDALHALSTGDFQWFYTANNGREGLFMNLIAVCFAFFGVSPLTLKLPAVIFGTLTILGTYFLTKELFRSNKIALVAAFLNSVAFWSINFSRISFRANMLPFVLVWTFFFLFKGIRTKKFYYYAIGGFIFGIGMHTYIAFRIAPVIAAVILIAFMLSRKNFLREHWKPIVVFFVFSLLAASPMFYTFWKHPEFLESRSGSVSVFSSQVNQGHMIQTFLRSFGLSLIKYNFFGDMNWRHNFPPYPILDPITGTAFLFGIIYSSTQFFKLLYARLAKKIQDDNFAIHAFLLTWFFAMLAPEFLTAEGNPHALRAIGTLPVVFIFAAVTFKYLFERAEKRSLLFRKTALVIIILALAATGIFNAVKYHIVWANKIETARSFERVLMNVSDYIRALPATTQKFIVTGSMQRIPIKVFNNEMPLLSFYYPGEIEQIDMSSKNTAVILTERNDEIINTLKNKFPGIELEERKDALGISFYVLK